MERYSREQRIEIIKIHYTNGENITETCNEVRTLFGRNKAPSQQIIMNLVKNFESLGHVGDAKPSIRSGKVKSAKNITTVIERLAENQADGTNETKSKTKENPSDDQLNTVSPTVDSSSNKSISNDINDVGITLTQDDSNKVSTTTNDKTVQLKPKNSRSAPKAARKMKKPRHR